MELPAIQNAAPASLELPSYVAHESELPAVEGCEWELESADEEEELVLATFEGLRESSGGGAASAALHGTFASRTGADADADLQQSAVLRVLGLETDTPLAQLVRVGDGNELLGASAVFRGYRKPLAGGAGTPLLFARSDSSDAPLSCLGAQSAQLQFTRMLLVPKQAEVELPVALTASASSQSQPIGATLFSAPSS